MSKFVVTISLDNAAFDEYPQDEVAYILTNLRDAVVAKGLGIHTLFDVNGNTVGRAELIEDNPVPFTCATQRRAK